MKEWEGRMHGVSWSQVSQLSGKMQSVWPANPLEKPQGKGLPKPGKAGKHHRVQCLARAFVLPDCSFFFADSAFHSLQGTLHVCGVAESFTPARAGPQLTTLTGH